LASAGRLQPHVSDLCRRHRFHVLTFIRRGSDAGNATLDKPYFKATFLIENERQYRQTQTEVVMPIKENQSQPQSTQETPAPSDEADTRLCEDDSCQLAASTETETEDDCCCCCCG